MAAACSSKVPYRFNSEDSTVWSTIDRYQDCSCSDCGAGPRGVRRGGASVPPGAVATTRTPCGAISSDRAVVIALTPPFAAAYGSRLSPRVATEETLTIVPSPRSTMCGTTARQHHIVGHRDRLISAWIWSGG